MKPLIFLDIDGVLNDHEWDDVAGSCTIRRDCMKELNRIVHAVDAEVVISSAWRYMILGGSMTLVGFSHMLRTHGFTGATQRIIGHTGKDSSTGTNGRAMLIKDWMGNRSRPYLAIDDDDLGYTVHGVPVLLTDPKRGLTVADADKAIQMLNTH